MDPNLSVRFFDTQFQQQVRQTDLPLNPFEQTALSYLHGHVLDYGCGLGNLAVAAAQRGCSVVALDASTQPSNTFAVSPRSSLCLSKQQKWICEITSFPTSLILSSRLAC